VNARAAAMIGSPADPIPSTVPLRAARAALPELLDRVEHGGEPIAITRQDETAAMLVSLADFERLTGAA
jgi:prevent-host-death family protein